MSHIDSNTGADISATTVDSFLALSRIYLTSTDRLLALNLATMREILAETSPALRSLAGLGANGGREEFPGKLAMTRINRGLAYCRGLQDIAAQAQDEISQLLLTPVHASSWPESVPNPWPSIMAAFSKATPTGKRNGGSLNANARGRSA